MAWWSKALRGVKSLALGVLLIVLASLLLLLSDWGHRRPARRKLPSVALFQFASRPVVDDAVEGVVEALAARGFEDGRTVQLRRFNAENDLATANAIAKAIVDARHHLVVTVTTPCFQVMAAANPEGKVKHVFGVVTDPFASGVPIDRTDTLKRPPNLAGVGTFQPVKEAFQLARQLYPALHTVGEVWCPGEASSEACTVLGREVGAELGIKLEEATVDASTGVLEAARALVARGVQAIWIGGDNTVEMAATSVIKAAREGRIPVFSNAPVMVRDGALFAVGADYKEVGRVVGNMAADVLAGRDPGSIPIENIVPRRVVLNERALVGLRDPWAFPEEVKRQADVSAETGAPFAPRAPRGRSFSIGVAYFAPDPGLDEAMRGFFDGLKELGFVEGGNLKVRRIHAQGETVQIPAMLLALEDSGVDAIATFTTPVLTGALASVKRVPVVFAYVIDPIAAGAGRSFGDHRPGVTGVGCFPPLEETLRLLAALAPRATRVGVVYNSGEANSSKVVSVLRELAGQRGLTIVEGTATSSAEVGPAVQGVLARGIDVFYLPGDNTAYLAFDVVVQETTKARVPLLLDNDVFVKRGAVAGIGVRYYDNGKAAAPLLARVLLGESPAGIPIENVSSTNIAFNREAAARIGFRLSPAALAMAAPRGIQPTPAPGAARRQAQPWRLHFLSYSETTFVEDALKGLRAELVARGLVEGRDLTLKVASAQGDMATLSVLLDAATTDGADLVLVNSTVALQAAVKRLTTLPVVFGNVANPLLAGAGTSFSEHQRNVTGIATAGDSTGMARLVRECLPRARRVGSLVVPSEANSVFNCDSLRAALGEVGIELVTVPVATAAEVSDAALALSSGQVEAICQATANLVDTSFAAVAQAAHKSKKPLFAFSTGLVEEGGAAIAVARDYEQVGRDMAGLAVRVLGGESPATIPFSLASRTVLVVSPGNAAACGLEVPSAVLSRADKVVGH